MSAVEAKRTLVKSPPEVWDRVSDLSALAECLGAFREIRITRTQPETLVEWEGELATGSVRLESSGWGTKVVLTAEVVEAVVAEPVVEAEPVAVEAEPVAVEAPAVAVEPEPEPEAVSEPEPEATSSSVPHTGPTEISTAEEPSKRGWFARWRERRAAKRAGAPEPLAAPPEPLAAPPEPEPASEPAAITAEPATPLPSQTTPEAAPTPEPIADEPAAAEPIAGAEPAPTPEPTAPEPAPVMSPDDALTVLQSTLDHLGAAHHRPFSRG